MKKLYLDYNIFVGLIEGTASIEKLVSKVMDGSCFPIYSPAHIEEVALSTMRKDYSLDKTYEKLRFISKFTNDYELLPFERKDVRILNKDGIYLCEENPRKCYFRVIESYSNNDIAETIDGRIITVAEDYNFYSNDPQEFNNSDHCKVLHQYQSEISEALIGAMKKTYGRNISKLEANNFRFQGIKNDFQLYESFVNVIFNYLEIIRFFPEKKEKARSRLHDVSHAIYASYSDIFISGDKKLVMKMRAAFSYLVVPTKIIYLAYSKEKKEHVLIEY